MSALAERGTADYDADFYAWTQEQAERLRALRAAGRIPPELDLGNIAEEIESLGRSDFFAVESLMRNAFVHLMKVTSAPTLTVANHWRSQGLVFVGGMQQRYSRSMRRKLDVQAAWKAARTVADASLLAYGDRLLQTIPEGCPFAIDELFDPDFDFDVMTARLAERLRTNAS